jgi:molybdate/tungstate transport system substrate-binding protein
MKQIRIFHAGSMSWALQRIARAFEMDNPNIEVVLEGSGARAAARKVMEGQPCDLMVSADYRIIEDLLKPEYAKFNLLFAKTKLILSFTKQSLYREEINENNWYEILLRPTVTYGHTDPELDPAGYRARLCWQLAEIYYNKPGLYEKLVNALLPINILTDSTMIRNRMQAGTLDYFFGYEATARQRGTCYLNLPSAIDFSTVDYADDYARVEMQLTGKCQETQMKVVGYPIQYGITLIEQAPQREEAIRFLVYALTHGQRFVKEAGFIPLPLKLSVDTDYEYLPTTLRQLL